MLGLKWNLLSHHACLKPDSQLPLFPPLVKGVRREHHRACCHPKGARSSSLTLPLVDSALTLAIASYKQALCGFLCPFALPLSVVQVQVLVTFYLGCDNTLLCFLLFKPLTIFWGLWGYTVIYISQNASSRRRSDDVRPLLTIHAWQFMVFLFKSSSLKWNKNVFSDPSLLLFLNPLALVLLY